MGHSDNPDHSRQSDHLMLDILDKHSADTAVLEDPVDMDSGRILLAFSDSFDEADRTRNSGNWGSYSWRVHRIHLSWFRRIVVGDECYLEMLLHMDIVGDCRSDVWEDLEEEWGRRLLRKILVCGNSVVDGCSSRLEDHRDVELEEGRSDWLDVSVRSCGRIVSL